IVALETPQAQMQIPPILKRPSACLPLAMSAAALGTVIVHVALFGAAREPDEGSAAHIFQILIAMQVPIVGYFAITWLPRAPRAALGVLSLQALAILVALTPVFLLQL